MRLSLIIQFVVLLVIGCVAGVIHSRTPFEADSRKLIASYLSNVTQRDSAAEGEDTPEDGDPAVPEQIDPDENEQSTPNTDGPETVDPDPDAQAENPDSADTGDALDPAQWPLEITIEQAFAAYASEDLAVFFMDARDQEDYEAGHVTRAMHVTNEMFMDESLLPPDIGFWPEDQLIIVYCTGGHCDLSHMVKTRLELFNLTNVHIMTDGFDGWAEAGHPVTEGSEP
ncbi:MAG: hypothetical protein D8M59_06510 [Planctomycetes bacterium]|nr:hypothetical protein [Planctomycetota bacterium]NOG55152.1 hypothetical protein [Planctomycetota bacterium]